MGKSPTRIGAPNALGQGVVDRQCPVRRAVVRKIRRILGGTAGSQQSAIHAGGKNVCIIRIFVSALPTTIVPLEANCVASIRRVVKSTLRMIVPILARATLHRTLRSELLQIQP